ncbi:MAG TPA: hypothetical protein VH143_19960 [Kofleriaceae bacterium]|nr:hypothetical protein [Kofleriaceae bacterium]
MASRIAITQLAVAALFGCGGGGGFPDAPAKQPPQDPGTLALSWSLVDSAGSATTCGSANAQSVVVAITQEVTGEQFGQTFACSLGIAVSGSLPTASYDLTFGLYDGSNTLLSMGSAQTGVMVIPDMTAHVANVVFVVP